MCKVNRLANNILLFFQRTIYCLTPEYLIEDYFGVQDKLNRGIKKDFEKAGIEMSYPTQTVYVRK